MRRLFLPLLSSVLLVGLSGTAEAKSSKSSAKSDVCHVTGNGSTNLLSVSQNAVSAHLSHGDNLPWARSVINR